MALVCLSLVFIVLHTSLHTHTTKVGTFVIFKIKWIHILRTIGWMNVWIAGWMYIYFNGLTTLYIVCYNYISYVYTHSKNCIHNNIYIHTSM